MKLRAAYKDKAQIPEADRGRYVLHEEGELAGLWVLDVEEAEDIGIDKVAKLRTALSSEREEAKKAKRQLKELTEKLGDLDLEEARKAIEAIRKGKQPDVEERIQGALRQAEEKFKGEREKLTARERRLLREVQRLLIDSEGRRLAKELGVEDVELALPHIANRAFVEEIGEGDEVRFEARIRDADGKTVKLSPKAGSNQPMSLHELIDVDLRKAHPRLFKASPASGTGGRDGQRGRSSGAEARRQDGGGNDDRPVSPTERLKQARREATAGAWPRHARTAASSGAA